MKKIQEEKVEAHKEACEEFMKQHLILNLL